MKLTLIPLSSLTKVFPDEKPSAAPFAAASCLRNEVFSFQVAVLNEVLPQTFTQPFFTVEAESDGLPVSVGLVGVEPV